MKKYEVITIKQQLFALKETQKITYAAKVSAEANVHNLEEKLGRISKSGHYEKYSYDKLPH